MPPDMMNAALATAGEVAPRDEMPAQDSAEQVMTGGLLSSVPGRTDLLEISVPSGAYVLPADIVSALGEGNTLAGTQILEEMFPPVSPGEGEIAAPVPIIAAGGEYIITPNQVAALADGDIDHGHDLLDGFVKDIRADLVKTLKALPGPAR